MVIIIITDGSAAAARKVSFCRDNVGRVCVCIILYSLLPGVLSLLLLLLFLQPI